MGGADDARLRVGEEHGPAIGGRGPDGDARPVGDDSVGLRPLARKGLARHDHVGRMDLVGGKQVVGGNAHPFGRAAAVLAHQRLVVGRAGADVQSAIDPFRDAAGTREIAVPDAG